MKWSDEYATGRRAWWRARLAYWSPPAAGPDRPAVGVVASGFVAPPVAVLTAVRSMAVGERHMAVRHGTSPCSAALAE